MSEANKQPPDLTTLEKALRCLEVCAEKLEELDEPLAADVREDLEVYRRDQLNSPWLPMWINQQSQLLICIRTMLVGPAVVIREGHHVIGTGETLEEAVAAAIKKQNLELCNRASTTQD